MRFVVRFLLIIVVLFTSYSVLFGQIKGKVIGVSDGDTFKILMEDKQKIRIRVYGIDCPESGQDYGNVAKKYTSDLIYGKEVFIEDKGLDKYGRQLGIVYVLPDSVCLNTELLKAGLAWHYKYFDKNQKWAELEQEARKQKMGLWQMQSVVAPWDWRRG